MSSEELIRESRRHPKIDDRGMMDVPFLVLVLLLVAIGLLMMFSASYAGAFVSEIFGEEADELRKRGGDKASRSGSKLYQVNIGGTCKVIRQCLEHHIGKMIYVSSVHAIPEKPKNCVITEDCEFSPGLVDGDYAKSKAAATEMVFSAARQGLSVNIVFPSGIIGPGDMLGGSFTSMAKSFLTGKLPFAVRGGYDFVDVRDVAKGILACAENGESGKGYILSGHYITIRRMLQIVGKAAKLIYRPICLPLKLARLAAPYCERRCLKEKKPLFFTPYSISVLGSNGRFTHDAATERFAYRPRPIEETLRDMTAWLVSQKAKAGSAL